MSFERNEYPRPQFRRDEWLPLNGEWEFELDDENDGEKRGLPTGRVALNRKINVPFSYQYAASGIKEEEFHETVWYRRTFFVGAEFAKKRALLCFNACDYETQVWINGGCAATHTGGYSPFSRRYHRLFDGRGKFDCRALPRSARSLYPSRQTELDGKNSAVGISLIRGSGKASGSIFSVRTAFPPIL